MNRSALVLLFLLLLSSGIPRQLSAGEEVQGLPADAESLAHEIAAAETAQQRAAEARAEWLQTGFLIEQARDAGRKGDWQAAVALAREARRQGELAVEQAKRESVAWHERVVR